jgi:hypothetical protein
VIAAGAAQASTWHLVSSFGKNGVAGLPVRERAAAPLNQGGAPPPERFRSLVVPGPQGSVLVGGYANSKPGTFLVSRHALGAPDRRFGHNGVAQYKVVGRHGYSIVTAAVVEPNGDILAVYQKELPQPPSSSPGVPEGQGNGAIVYTRLLPSGALDHSFGQGGFLDASGEKVGFIEGESGTVGACGETLSTSGSLLVAYESFALEELSPAGVVVTSFGDDPYRRAGRSRRDRSQRRDLRGRRVRALADPHRHPRRR